MIEKKLDIWTMLGKAPTCITTNGCVKAGGQAVAGKGIAKQACEHIPGFAKLLGRSIKKFGNVVNTIYVPNANLSNVLSFPVKPVTGVCAHDKKNIVHHLWHYCNVGDYVAGWVMKAQIGTIERSLWELQYWVTLNCTNVCRVYLPRPGCGAGGLDWKTQVKPLCEKYGDWLVCVTL